MLVQLPLLSLEGLLLPEISAVFTYLILNKMHSLHSYSWVNSFLLSLAWDWNPFSLFYILSSNRNQILVLVFYLGEEKYSCICPQTLLHRLSTKMYMRTIFHHTAWYTTTITSLCDCPLQILWPLWYLCQQKYYGLHWHSNNFGDATERRRGDFLCWERDWNAQFMVVTTWIGGCAYHDRRGKRM